MEILKQALADFLEKKSNIDLKGGKVYKRKRNHTS